MTVDEILFNLIEQTYGTEEARRHSTYRPSDEDLNLAKQAGAEILRRSPMIPGACAYLFAMWTAMLRDNMSVPAFCVAGDLNVRGCRAFGSSDPNVAKNLLTSSMAWDGHCWLVLGSYVGDLSIFRSAYAAPERSNLRATVIEQFGFGHELFLGSWTHAQQTGFDYIPKHVANDAEVNELIQGALANGRFQSENET